MPVTSDSGNRFLLLYGTATGQSKAIAEEIAERASKFGLVADIQDVSETGKGFNLEREKCMVIVISTSGDGDPPAGASTFVRRLKKRTLGPDHLSGLHYALLGLGDSNYSNFCRCGRDVDKRLEVLGAKRFYNTGWADDAVGLEVVADPWLDGLFPALQKFLGVSSEGHVSLTETVGSLSLSDRNEDMKKSVAKDTNLQIQPNSVTSDTNTTVSSDSEKELLINGGSDSHTQHGSDISVGSVSDSQSEKSNIKEEEPKNTSSNNCDDTACNSDGSGQAISPVLSLSESGSQTTSPESESQSQSPTSLKDNHDNSKDKDYSTVNNHVTSSEPTSVAQKWPETPCIPITLDVTAPTTPLTCSQSPLSEKTLTIPVLPPPFLSATFSSHPVKISDLPYQNGCKLPSAASNSLQIGVTSAQVLTTPDAVKKALLLRLNIKGTDIKYSPGDSISVICPNNSSEVDLLLQRLGVTDKADMSLTLSVLPETTKRRAAIPAHVHPTSTLRHTFTTCLNIREPPSKAFIRALVEHTSDAQELRRMQELCSKDGAQEYTDLIRGHHITLLDFLYAFPSCKPPVERIIEHLPRLQPRPYSACSCQEVSPDYIDIVFNVVEIPTDISEGHYYQRRGVCTGWLDDITTYMQEGKEGSKIEIPIFLRTNQHFHPPDDLSKPIIMIGPGTGVAPFLGFLQQRALHKKSLNEEQQYGSTWLFYGCRNQDKDFLFRNELHQFESTGTLSKLCVAFSRDQPQENLTINGDVTKPPRYVQDLMRSFAAEMCQLLSESDALVYVCGDAKNMAKDVNSAFEEILQKEKGLSQEDAHMFMMKKRIHKTFFEDVWV